MLTIHHSQSGNNTSNFSETTSGLGRVVHVVRSLEVGGLERLVHDLCGRRSIENTSVLCLSKIGHFGEVLSDRGFKVISLNVGKPTVTSLRAFNQCIAELNPDVLHCHNLQSFLYATLANKIYSRRNIVLTKHGTVFPKKLSATSLIFKFFGVKTHYVGVSREICTLLEKAYTKSTIEYIPNGIDLSPYENLQSHSQKHDVNACYTIVTVGRMAAAKDHSTLLHAVQHLKGSLNFRLKIVGDGPMREEIQSLSSSLGLDEIVQFMGERNDIPQQLGNADIFVLSSKNEGLPMTILEAMAAGIPIVSTDVGDIPNVIENERTGLLVPPSDPARLADALECVAKNSELRQRLATAARQVVQDQYSLSAVADRYERLYRRFVS